MFKCKSPSLDYAQSMVTNMGKDLERGISYLELESSGLRDEIRYHYIHNGKPRTEALPYRMADGQWHKVALSVSASHLMLHVDCNRTTVANQEEILFPRTDDPSAA
ncbi:Protein kinase C-binding protein NELL1 [Tupaia chinensis]|uniref:Protein kinase C-binding protein NELL1 n=1 Tax=Tupaia chinensis TaxID=246437 RepID=L9L1V2_TUPCH|nr:Protein kinase C-binding protein NELL1 [Tupaia chinensis]